MEVVWIISSDQQILFTDIMDFTILVKRGISVKPAFVPNRVGTKAGLVVHSPGFFAEHEIQGSYGVYVCASVCHGFSAVNVVSRISLLAMAISSSSG